ncbi:MAG: adenosylcobinamide-GDP ribazoletransferase [Candidatus Pelethousia sp.]|nr:adenosylcobinamide-GDP ribazoletransferase [Candidatus Pelethousia sp.]
MRFFEPLWIAISTYSVLPVPRFEWNEDNMRFALCFLPLVGLFVGAALLVWVWACRILNVGAAFFAAVATALPLLLTGSIHMDGFMDTVDALASHQSKERKLAILKDSHVGAFAVIYCGVYLLLNFGLYQALFQTPALLSICWGFILSRSLSAFSALTLPNARGTGMLSAFTEHARGRAAMIIASLLAAGGMVWASPMAGGLAAAFAALATLGYRRMALKQFGGVTGDTSGFFLQACELALLFGLWIGGQL